MAEYILITMKTAKTKPSYFSTADPGSFARKTLRERKPAIIDQVIAANRYVGTEGDALLSLKDVMRNGGGIERWRLFMSSIRGMATLREKLAALVTCSLRGNRVYLSLFQIAERSRERDPFDKTARVLVDDGQRLVGLLERARRIDFILDNSGQELVCDLFVALNLISAAKSVHFHAKKHPYYVSDGQGEDVTATVAALGEDRDPDLSAAGKELSSSLRQERLVIHEHFFWNGPLHYPELPRKIVRELRRSDLVIREDPEWRVNGERGTIRVVERHAPWN
jgi:hypothetical protein